MRQFRDGYMILGQVSQIIPAVYLFQLQSISLFLAGRTFNYNRSERTGKNIATITFDNQDGSLRCLLGANNIHFKGLANSYHPWFEWVHWVIYPQWLVLVILAV